MSRRETEDGTYFGLPHDEAWRVDTDTRVNTDTLSGYRLNMEENAATGREDQG